MEKAERLASCRHVPPQSGVLIESDGVKCAANSPHKSVKLKKQLVMMFKADKVI